MKTPAALDCKAAKPVYIAATPRPKDEAKCVKSRISRSRPLRQVVARFADATTALTAAEAAARVDELIDLGVARLFRSRNHGHGQFALGAVASLHDFANPQTAVLSWDVRLLTVSRRLDGGEGRRWLVMEGKVVQGGKLHTVVEVLGP